MIKDLNKILVEWSYRTSDGKPDVKNSAKLIVLESVLNDLVGVEKPELSY